MGSTFKINKIRIKKCILIVGMHRSGTSLLTDFIHQLGYSIGLDIMAPSFDNPKGFFENNQIVNLNDDLLNRLSSSWDKPFILNDSLEQSKIKNFFLDQLEKILRNEFAEESKILIKDPRISLMLPLWIKALEHFNIKDIRIIISIRHPQKIASSLFSRNGLVAKRSLFLTSEYMMSAEVASRNLKRSFFLYEEALKSPSAWDKKIKEFIGFTQNGEHHIKLVDIIDNNLQKSTQKNVKIKEEHVVYEIYNEFRNWNRNSINNLKDLYQIHLTERTYLIAWSTKVHSAKLVLFSDRSSIPGEIINRPAKSGVNQISVSLEGKEDYHMLHFIPVDDSCSIEIMEFNINGKPSPWTTASLLFKNNRHYYNFNYPIIKVNHPNPIKTIDIKYDIADLNQDISKIVTIELRSEKLQELESEFEKYKKNQKSEQALLQNELINLEKEFRGHQTKWSLEKQKEYIAYQRSIQELFHKYEDKTEKYLVKIDNLNLHLNELQERHAKQLEEVRKGYELSKGVLSDKISDLSASLDKLHILHEDKLEKEKEKSVQRKQQLKKIRREKKALEGKLNNFDSIIENYNQKIAENRAIIQKQHQEILKFKEDYSNRERELKEVSDSLSYKVGRLTTWPLRMLYESGKLIASAIPALAGILSLFFTAPGKLMRTLNWSNFLTLFRALRYESPGQILRNVRKKIGLPSHLSQIPKEVAAPQSSKRKTVLYISPNLPDYDNSSGGRRATKMISLLAEFSDIYVFTKGARPSKYRKKLTDIGARVIDDSDYRNLFSAIPKVDTLIFAWYYTIHDHATLMVQYPNAQVIIDTVDVHWVREQRSIGQVKGLDEISVAKNKKIELEAYQHADIIWVVSEEDKNAVLAELPDAQLQIVSNIHELEVTEYNPSSGSNLLFFGGYNHPPNITAAHLLTKEIFPEVLRSCPEARLIIAGAKAPDDVEAMGQLPNVEFKGFIPEEELPDLYAHSLVSVAPLTAGAGIKGKICESISYHVPVVTTDIGNEGIRLNHEYDGFVGKIEEFPAILVDIIKKKYDLGLISKRAQQKLGSIVGPKLASMRMRESIYPEISICIVTWNRLDLLRRCITSIIEHTDYPYYKILVHSNGCTDGTQEYLKQVSEQHEHVIPFLSSENEVFVRPNNAMMRTYEGNDVVLLNNDTYVTKGWLRALRKAAYSEPEIGISGSKILYPDGRLQEFGSELYENGTGKNIGKWDDPDKEEYQDLKRVGYVSGCSMYIKRSTIDIIGYLDDQFHPCYCEDSDYAYTAWEHGIQTVVTPGSIIYHDEGGTSGTDEESGFKAYQKINFEKFLKKHGDNLSALNNHIDHLNEECIRRAIQI